MITKSEDQSFIIKLASFARTINKSKAKYWSEDIPESGLDEIELSIKEAD